MNLIERIDNFIQNNNVLDTVVTKVLGAVLPQKTAYAACFWDNNAPLKCLKAEANCGPGKYGKYVDRRWCCYNDTNGTLDCGNWQTGPFVSCGC